MSFDSHSLERLRELGRSLPTSLPTPKANSSANQKPSTKLHPIETEQDPQKLFGELIKASPDGTIPSHLISRLKEAEFLDAEKKAHKKYTDLDKPNKESSNHSNKEKLKPDLEKDDLYISFKRLLLEEES